MWVETCKHSIKLWILATVLLQGACGEAINNSASSPAASVDARESWIVLQDRSWVPVRDSFTAELQRARNAFESGSFRIAANLFRQAATSLRRDRPGLSSYHRERIEEAALELDRLAALAERGELRRSGSTDPILSRVCELEEVNRWPSAPIDVWLPLAGKPEEHFRKCEESVSRGDLAEAATEIQKAVGFMRLDAGRSTLEGRMLISQSIHSLGGPLRQLENTYPIDSAALDWVFARAEQSLARAHQLNAVEAWAKNQPDLTGAELQSAAMNLEEAALRFGRTDQFAAFAETRITARELILGKGYDELTVDRTLDTIARQIRESGDLNVPVTAKRP